MFLITSYDFLKFYSNRKNWSILSSSHLVKQDFDNGFEDSHLSISLHFMLHVIAQFFLTDYKEKQSPEGVFMRRETQNCCHILINQLK